MPPTDPKLDQIQGDSFTGNINYSIIGGQGNTNQICIHDHGLGPIFDRLCEHVASNAFLNSAEVSDQPKCHEGTRIAIIARLTSWAATLPYDYSTTWLHGPAGSGKSTILRTVARLLFEKKLLLASFFFFRSSAGRNNVEKFIPSLAYQLALSIPATRPLITQAIEANPLLFSTSLEDQAQALIIDPVHAVHAKSPLDAGQYPRIFIIDGLDECADNDKQCEVLLVLFNILQQLSVPFAILIASRPEFHIRAAFDLGDLNKNSTRLSLDNRYKPCNDIRRYLTDRFRVIRETHSLRKYLPTSWPPEGVIEELVAKASGQFIYASTVDKFISSVRHHPAIQLKIVMKAPGSGTMNPFEQLDALYSAIFGAIKFVDLEGTLRILGFLFLLSDRRRDLRAHSPAFLERLLGLQEGDIRRLLFDLGSLLMVGRDDEDVRFFHTSLSDYLFDRSRSGKFWIDAGAIHAEIAERYLPCSLELWDWQGMFVYDYLKHVMPVFMKASPTTGLREAIESNNFAETKRPPGTSYKEINGRCLPALLLAIRNSTFVDAERLYQMKLAQYSDCIQSSIQMYSKDAALKLCLVISAFLNPGCHNYGYYVHMFSLSEAMRQLDQDNERGFCLSEGYDYSFRTVIKDIFENREGLYFIDKSGYADAALHLMKCMTKSSKFYATGAILGIFDARFLGGKFEENLAEAFQTFLSRSVIRWDLLQYMEEHPLSDVYLKCSQVSSAFTEYQKRANSLPWWERLSFSLGRIVWTWVKLSVETYRTHSIWIKEDEISDEDDAIWDKQNEDEVEGEYGET